jgi:signal transduction histidine kinase
LLDAMTNTLRHSHATELHLAARATDGGIHVALTNNGPGLDGVPVAALRTMHEHAVGLGAVLEVSTPHPGACIRLLLPQAC